ncbi:MAG TPA: FG-GAP-like repeat-containing protein, partial [Pyrinomonadaceae bacterium]
MKNTKIILLLVALFAISSCRPAANLPSKSSPQYNELVRSFYIGLAALQVGHDVQADAKLSQFTQLAAGEPAGWANWGLLALRQRNYDTAAERLQRARELAPDNSQIFYLVGLLESSRGNSAEAITALRKAVDLDQHNLIAIYKLAEEVERQGDEKSAQEFQELVQKILATEPDNVAALVELARAAAKRGDAQTLNSAMAKINARSSAWPDEVKQQVTAVADATKSNDLRAAATRTSFLRNVLMRVPEYRRDLSAIKPPPGEEAVPFTHFLKLESPVFAASPADTSLSFNPEEIASAGSVQASWIGAISLSGSGAPVIAYVDERNLHLASGATIPFPVGSMPTPTRRHGVLPIDFNYDFKTDLVLAGAGGVRLFRQDSPTTFTDVTAETKLPATVLNRNYSGAWGADIEADGDLDIILGSNASLVVLRNNGDGTFTDIQPFSGVSSLESFAWADLDADGDPDAALIDGSHKLHGFSNERQGQFTERSLPSAATDLVETIGVMDVDNDGVLDLIEVQPEGIFRLSDKDGSDWVRTEIAKNPVKTMVDLFIADLDNNGGLDLVVTTSFPLTSAVKCLPKECTAAWLNDGNGKFELLPNSVWEGDRGLFDIADVNNDGRLDLLGISQDLRPTQAINHGSKNYHYQIVRPRAANAVGDQRINPFGVGGEMEIRSGLMVQKQPITGPMLHFGLGDQTSADVIRVVWPNGTVRAEFEVKADQEVLTEQRLKASCPFLFAYNGKQMEFVKDAVPWGSAIGLRINTIGSASIAATGEWYKIRRDQLVPHDGYYDIRVTAELWEVYYYDYIGLMPVDHPEGTEIFVDERFVVPPAKLGFTTVATPKLIKQAIDDNGRDVTELLSARDGKALDSFGRGQYQGVTRDHYV